MLKHKWRNPIWEIVWDICDRTVEYIRGIFALSMSKYVRLQSVHEMDSMTLAYSTYTVVVHPCVQLSLSILIDKSNSHPEKTVYFHRCLYCLRRIVDNLVHENSSSSMLDVEMALPTSVADHFKPTRRVSTFSITELYEIRVWQSVCWIPHTCRTITRCMISRQSCLQLLHIHDGFKDDRQIVYKLGEI